MLTLKRDRSNVSHPSTAPPKYIPVNEANTIGRGIKSDVRLVLPWLSRRHVSILQQGAHTYIQAHSGNAVFLNGIRKTWEMLRDKDVITIGGARKGLPDGMPFPGRPGPFIEYEFTPSKYAIKFGENIYQRIDPNDSFSLEEEVNGRMVQEYYCAEDFNETQECIELPEEILNPKETTSLSMTPSHVTCKVKQDLSFSLDGVTDIDTPASVSTPGQKRGRSRGRGRGARGRSNSAARSSLRTSSTLASAATATPPPEEESRDNLSVIDDATPSTSSGTGSNLSLPSTSSDLGSSYTDDYRRKSATMSSSSDSLWATFDKTSETVDSILKTIEAKMDKAKIITGESTSANSGNGDQAVKKAKGRKQTASKSNINSDTSSVDPKGQNRSRRQSRKSVKYFDPSDSSGGEKDEDSKSACSMAKEVNKSANSKTIEVDLNYLPDLDDVADNVADEVEISFQDDLPEIPKCSSQTSDSSVLKAWALAKSQAKKRPLDDDWGDKKSTKKAKRGSIKGKPTRPYIGPETQALIDRWKRPPPKPVKPKFVTVLEGIHARHLVNFENQEIFRTTYLEPHVDKVLLNLTVSIDVANLSQKLMTGELSKDDTTKLFELVANSQASPSMEDFDKPKLLPDDYTMQQPVALELQLKQYQLNTLSWMLMVESKAQSGWRVSKLCALPKAKMDILFDLSNNRVFVPPYPKNKDTILTIKSKGGILADQMGLGKTITLLALFAQNPPPKQRIPDPDTFKYQDTHTLPSGATLVIAPSHLVGQWKDEITTHAPGLHVEVIVTKQHHEMLSYLDLMLADVIIVSVQFLLTNKSHTKMPSGEEAVTSFLSLINTPGTHPLLKKTPNLSHIQWWRLVADEAHELLRYEDHKRKGNNVPSDGLVTMGNLHSRFRWYVTGTPFPHGAQSLRAALKFLELELDDPTLVHVDGSPKVEQTYQPYMKSQSSAGIPLHEAVLNYLYVRNTKTSIGNEYDVPEFVEELILLTMSDVERGVYDRSLSPLERRQLCCHLQIADRIKNVAGAQQKSLDEVRIALVEQAHKDIDQTEKRIKSTEDEIKKVKDEIRDEHREHMRKLLRDREERLRKSVENLREEMGRHNSAITYFNSIGPRIDHSADEPCVICLEEIKRLAVTPCGHLFCRECIFACITRQSQCPTCRKPIMNEQQIIEVTDAKGRQELSKSKELRQMTEKYGTKMAFLIFYLRNLLPDDSDSRVIIFSQWDSLLQKIGETLNENLINNVFVKGNVFVRNKAIMSFRASDLYVFGAFLKEVSKDHVVGSVGFAMTCTFGPRIKKQSKSRVIMLSLQNAASGTNLVEATHVILIDPVAGSKEEAIAIESQAIGRAHRMGQDKQISVVRMVMRDTVEHELYLRNNSEDIAQVEFNFEKTGTMGGPQVVRTVRKVPEPDPAVLRTALQHLEPEPSPFSNPRRRNGRGRANNRNRIGMLLNNMMDFYQEEQFYEAMELGSDDDDMLSDDSDVDTPGGPNDCCLS